MNQKEGIAKLFKANRVQNKSSSMSKFKFGVQVPTNPKHAIRLNEVNKDDLWKGVMDKEIGSINTFKRFAILEENEYILEGYKQIPYHMIFDVKFDGRRKSRLVVGGHRAPEVPKEEIYPGVVSMENIRTTLVLASLNGLDGCAADVSTSFLYGKTRENVFVISGDEFGENKEKRILIDMRLYGLESSAAIFHETLSSTLRDMNFTPYRADHDLWMRDKGDHWEYIAIYVDDLLGFSKEPMKIIDTIKKTYDLRGVGTPEYYLGGDFDNNFNNAESKEIPGISETDHSEKEKNLLNIWLKHGVKTAFSARTYIKENINRLETIIGKEFVEQKTPISETLHPEIDDSPILNPLRYSQFRSLVGCANWLVTLGQFDIVNIVNTFSRFSMQPRKYHFKGMIRLFGYLKKFRKGKIHYRSKLSRSFFISNARV